MGFGLTMERCFAVDLYMAQVPLLPKPTLTRKRSLSLTEAVDDELELLKNQFGLDWSEWVRGLILDELPTLRKRLEAATKVSA